MITRREQQDANAITAFRLALDGLSLEGIAKAQRISRQGATARVAAGRRILRTKPYEAHELHRAAVEWSPPSDARCWHARAEPNNEPGTVGALRPLLSERLWNCLHNEFGGSAQLAAIAALGKRRCHRIANYGRVCERELATIMADAGLDWPD